MQRINWKITILCILTLGVSLLMFGCGSKDVVNPLGDNLEYSYDKHSKVLTISGQGDMPDNSGEIFRELTIKSLVIEEGVTRYSLLFCIIFVSIIVSINVNF